MPAAIPLIVGAAVPGAHSRNNRTFRRVTTRGPRVDGHFTGGREKAAMTILNVVFDRRSQSALVGVDTLGAAHDGSHYHCAKLMPFVHIPAVVALRGNSAFLSIVTCTITWTLWRDLDDLLELMPRYLADGYKQLIVVQQAGHIPASLALEEQTIVVVGWSERQQKIIARKWTQKTAAEGFIADDAAPYHIAPYDASIDYVTNNVRTPADMERLARAQVALLNERFPGSGTGGKLVVARLERGSLSIRHQCDLDAPVMRALAFG
jgi:hypothetical protein